MPFKRELWAEKLTERELARVTEINMQQILEKVLKNTITMAYFYNVIDVIAHYKGINPLELKELAKKMVLENKKFMTSKNELVEVYYRYGISRRQISKLCKVSDKRITEVMLEAGKASLIKDTRLGKKELKNASIFIGFFTDIADTII